MEVKIFSSAEILKQCEEVAVPEEVGLRRVPTRNGYGYIFYNISPLGHEFINDAAPGKKMFEVGAGFSNIAAQCLRAGVVEYAANDLSLDHLKILTVRLQQQFGQEALRYWSALKLLPGKVPDVLPEVSDYYDALLIDKVLHFLTPDECEKFLAWVFKALKKGGKLYILTVAPYSKRLVDTERLLITYNANKKTGTLYPGYVSNVKEYLIVSPADNPQFAIPSQTIFFTQEDLAHLLQSKHFEIKKTMKVVLPTVDVNEWCVVGANDYDLTGIVAQKPL